MTLRLLTALLFFAMLSPSANSADLALTGGTIYPGPSDAPIRNGVVLIRDGKIAAVGSRAAVELPGGVQTIDCSGLTITAAFQNSHVHFFERKWINAAEIPAAELARQLEDWITRFGFTSVFDLSSPWDNTRRIRDRIESGEVPGPRIRSTGMGLLPPNPGIPPDSILDFMGVMRTHGPEVADAEQARAESRKLLHQGVDAIKLFVSAPSKSMMTDEVIRAAVNEAHQAGKPVFIHPNTAADVMAAVRNGVDIIGHTTPRSPWDKTLLAAMMEKHVGLIPTLYIWDYYLRHDRVSAQERNTDVAVRELHDWVALGGTVLFGTDLGAVEYDPTPEYVLMAKAGMTFSQILASLTTAPAGRFGDSKRLGRVAVGLDADLAVLIGDPSADIRALAAVRYTIRAGRLIFRRNE